MPVTRNAMAAYQNQDLALSGLAAQVQRAAEGELLPGDVGDHAAMLFGNGQRIVGRTRVDEHGFDIQPLRLLAGNAFQQFAQVTRFIQCRSEEHTSELQSLMRISYAVFCLQKKKTTPTASPTT